MDPIYAPGKIERREGGRFDYSVGFDEEYDGLLRRLRTDIYRLTVYKEEDGDEGTAGVREPLRPKPLIPAAALALEV